MFNSFSTEIQKLKFEIIILTGTDLNKLFLYVLTGTIYYLLEYYLLETTERLLITTVGTKWRCCGSTTVLVTHVILYCFLFNTPL